MRKLDILIVRFLPFVLYVIFIFNVWCACTNRDPFVSYELHGNSAFYSAALFVISLANKRYHCVWNRAMYVFLILIPILNYLDSVFCIFEYEATYMWFVSISTSLTAIITAFLAIRHFVLISKRRLDNELKRQRQQHVD